MNLSFSELINNKEQHFIIKIWLSLDPELKSNDFCRYHAAYLDKFGKPMTLPDVDLKFITPKIHTIRRLRKTASGTLATLQWRAGRSIHLSINPGVPSYFRFAPLIYCSSTQEITIKWPDQKNILPEISIDQRQLNSVEIDLLARNDGFDTTGAFTAYFNTDFTGTLVHWTTCRY